MNKIIFIAVPTSGVVTNGRMNESFHRDVARLHEQYPSHTFLVPMIQDYALLPHMTVDATYEVWGHHCETLITVSDEVWVVKYAGWGCSVGVAGEIAHAEKLGKPVVYVDPTTLMGC